jgi:ferredoxin like protein
MSVNVADYLGPPKLLGRDAKLALDVIRVNEPDPHLRIIDQQVCKGCRDKPCTVTCPVDNYHAEADGRTSIDWESCIECGTCRIICPYGNISWKYPAGGFGVSYRYG